MSLERQAGQIFQDPRLGSAIHFRVANLVRYAAMPRLNIELVQEAWNFKYIYTKTPGRLMLASLANLGDGCLVASLCVNQLFPLATTETQSG